MRMWAASEPLPARTTVRNTRAYRAVTRDGCAMRSVLVWCQRAKRKRGQHDCRQAAIPRPPPNSRTDLGRILKARKRAKYEAKLMPYLSPRCVLR